MNVDPLTGDPSTPTVRHILDVVTAKPGCEAPCPFLARVLADYGRAVGLTEAEVMTRYGRSPQTAPFVAPRGSGRAERGDSE